MTAGLPAVGDAIPPFVVPSVDAARMKTMSALMDDPNPIHFDVDSVRRQGLGDRLVNQGPSNMAYIVNALLAWTGDVASITGLRMRFNGNVFAGDHVVATGTVTAVEALDGGGHAVTCEVWLDRAGDRVVTGTATLRL